MEMNENSEDSMFFWNELDKMICATHNGKIDDEFKFESSAAYCDQAIDAPNIKRSHNTSISFVNGAQTANVTNMKDDQTTVRTNGQTNHKIDNEVISKSYNQTMDKHGPQVIHTPSVETAQIHNDETDQILNGETAQIHNDKTVQIHNDETAQIHNDETAEIHNGKRAWVRNGETASMYHIDIASMPNIGANSRHNIEPNNVCNVEANNMHNIGTNNMHNIESNSMHNVEIINMHSMKTADMHDAKTGHDYKLATDSMHNIKIMNMYSVMTANMHKMKNGSIHVTETNNAHELEKDGIHITETDNLHELEKDNMHITETDNAHVHEKDSMDKVENGSMHLVEPELMKKAKIGSMHVDEAEIDNIHDYDGGIDSMNEAKTGSMHDDKTGTDSIHDKEAELYSIHDKEAELYSIHENEAELDNMHGEAEMDSIHDSEAESSSICDEAEMDSVHGSEAESSSICDEAEMDSMHDEAEIDSIHDKAEIDSIHDNGEIEIDNISEAEIDNMSEAEIDSMSEAEIDNMSEAEIDNMSEAEIDSMSDAVKDNMSEDEIAMIQAIETMDIPEVVSNFMQETEIDSMHVTDSMHEAEVNSIHSAQRTNMACRELDFKSYDKKSTMYEAEIASMHETETDCFMLKFDMDDINNVLMDVHGTETVDIPDVLAADICDIHTTGIQDFQINTHNNITSTYDNHIASTHDTHITSIHDTHIANAHNTHIASTHDIKTASTFDIQTASTYDIQTASRSDEHVVSMYDIHTASIPNVQVANIPNDQEVSSRPDDQVASTPDDQVVSTPNDQVASTLNDQAARISDDQVASLFDDQVASMLDDQVASMLDDQVGSMLNDQVASIPDDQVASLFDYQVSSMLDDQVASIPNDQVANIFDIQTTSTFNVEVSSISNVQAVSVHNVQRPNLTNIQTTTVQNAQRMSVHDIETTNMKNQGLLHDNSSEIHMDGSIVSALKNLFNVHQQMRKKLEVCIHLLKERLFQNIKEQEVLRKEKCGGKAKMLSIKPYNCFTTPYFRDAKGLHAPRTEDAEEKKRNDYVDAYLLPPEIWYDFEEAALIKCIKENARLVASRPIALKAEHLLESRKKKYIKPGVKKQILVEVEKLNAKVEKIRSMSLKELWEKENVSLDWLMISTEMKSKCYDRTPETCELMWANYLQPGINKKCFTPKEDKELKNLALRCNQRDWDYIARKLGTNRTAIQCCERFQSTLNNKLWKSRWTPEEDQKLVETVEFCRIGNFIPWKKVIMYMSDRSLQQLQEHWKICDRPDQRGGPWTPKEDAILLLAYEFLGNRWMKVADLMHGRSSFHCKERYIHVLNPNLIFSRWTWEEDKLLLTLLALYGEKFEQISRSLVGRTQIMVKERCSVLKNEKPAVYEQVLKSKGRKLDVIIPKEQFAQSSIHDDINNKRQKIFDRAFSCARNAVQQLFKDTFNVSLFNTFKELATVITMSNLKEISDTLLPVFPENTIRYNAHRYSHDIPMTSEDPSSEEGEVKGEEGTNSQEEIEEGIMTQEEIGMEKEFDDLILPMAVLGTNQQLHHQHKLRTCEQAAEYRALNTHLCKAFHVKEDVDDKDLVKATRSKKVNFMKTVPLVLNECLLTPSIEGKPPVFPMNITTMNAFIILSLTHKLVKSSPKNTPPEMSSMLNNICDNENMSGEQCFVCKNKKQKRTRSSTKALKKRKVELSQSNNSMQVCAKCGNTACITRQLQLLLHRFLLTFAFTGTLAMIKPSKHQIQKFVLNNKEFYHECFQKYLEKAKVSKMPNADEKDGTSSLDNNYPSDKTLQLQPR